MTTLFIFPHPDDETVFAGGTMTRSVANGDRVVWVCASYGERSGRSEKRSSWFFYVSYWLGGRFRFLLFLQKVIVWILAVLRKPDQELAVIRKKEAEEVAGVFGAEVVFLEIEDMKFSLRKKELENKLAEIMERYDPDRIYTMHSNGITGHPDHEALTEAIMEIVEKSGSAERPEIFFATVPTSAVKRKRLPLYGEEDGKIAFEIELDKDELKKKTAALEKYASQGYIWEKFLEKNGDLLEKEYFIKG